MVPRRMGTGLLGLPIAAPQEEPEREEGRKREVGREHELARPLALNRGRAASEELARLRSAAPI